jgi:excisionase family DNA binding protein
MCDVLMSVSEVASACGVSQRTIRAWIADGRLASLKLGPGRHSVVRVSGSELARFLREGAQRGRERAIR